MKRCLDERKYIKISRDDKPLMEIQAFSCTFLTKLLIKLPVLKALFSASFLEVRHLSSEKIQTFLPGVEDLCISLLITRSSSRSLDSAK